MDDKTLADKVVALGFGEHESGGAGEGYFYFRDLWKAHADTFVSDWRVAGALMERCRTVDVWNRIDPHKWDVCTMADDSQAIRNVSGDSLPRAIVEACCLALEES